MSLAAKKSETNVPMPTEHAVLEERFDHIQSDVTDLKQNLRRVEGKVDNVQSELKDFKAQVANDFGDLKSQMATQFGEIKAQMKALEASMIKWMVGTMIAATSLAVTIVKLLH